MLSLLNSRRLRLYPSRRSLDADQERSGGKAQESVSKHDLSRALARSKHSITVPGAVATAHKARIRFRTNNRSNSILLELGGFSQPITLRMLNAVATITPGDPGTLPVL